MKIVILKFIYWVLANYARKIIQNHTPFVIGVTGSVGKTSTKEAIYQVLHDHFGEEVRKNYGNLNAEIGIPLTILGYEKVPNVFSWPVFLIFAYFRTLQKTYPKYLVLEMGVEHKGDMVYFGTIVKLDLTVITSASGAHLANFKDLAEYQQEKLSIRKIVKDNGKTIINADDTLLAKEQGGDVIRFGRSSKSDVDFKAEDINVTLTGTEFRICSLGQKIAVRSQLLGTQMVYSQLAAFSVGHLMGIQSLAIKKSLEKIEPINGRMKVIKGKKDCYIIDDTYNSNPTSLIAALEVLSQIKYTNRKVAIIGNMNELGELEKSSHESMASFALGKTDLAIFVGPNASYMQKAYGDAKSSLIFSNRTELEKSLDDIIKPKDLILVKASQNKNFFEEITKKLMQNPEQADNLLVRQGSFWKNRKR